MKKIAVLGIVVGVIVIALVTLILTGKHGLSDLTSSSTPCQKFIAQIEANNVSDSYNMLTNATKQGQTLRQWTVQVQQLAAAFGKSTKPKLISRNTFSDPVTNTPRTQEAYELTYEAVTYNVTCTSTQGNGGPIAAFNSTPKAPGS